jgi:hypothetical protein
MCACFSLYRQQQAQDVLGPGWLLPHKKRCSALKGLEREIEVYRERVCEPKPCGRGGKASQAHELVQPFQHPKNNRKEKKIKSVVSNPSQKRRGKKKIRRILFTYKATTRTYQHNTSTLYELRIISTP